MSSFGSVLKHASVVSAHVIPQLPRRNPICCPPGSWEVKKKTLNVLALYQLLTGLFWIFTRSTLQNYNIKTTDTWDDLEPTTVTKSDEVTILWDTPIHTDREINANRPDIVIKDKRERRCKIIDVAIPSDNNTFEKEAEKLPKYKDPEIEICRMWGMTTDTTPVVIGTLGLVKKGLERYTNNIPGNINIFEIQKIAILETAHILRRVLSFKWDSNCKTLGPMFKWRV